MGFSFSLRFQWHLCPEKREGGAPGGKGRAGLHTWPTASHGASPGAKSTRRGGLGCSWSPSQLGKRFVLLFHAGAGCRPAPCPLQGDQESGVTPALVLGGAGPPWLSCRVRTSPSPGGGGVCSSSGEGTLPPETVASVWTHRSFLEILHISWLLPESPCRALNLLRCPRCLFFL